MRLIPLTLALVFIASSGAAIATEPVKGSGPTGGTNPTEADPDRPPGLGTAPTIRVPTPTRPEPVSPSALKTAEPIIPGGCILRPGNPLGCGTGESPSSFMIGGANTVAKCLMIGGTVLNAGRLSRCKVPMSSAR